jgi:hypothetical protein
MASTNGGIGRQRRGRIDCAVSAADEEEKTQGREYIFSTVVARDGIRKRR